MLTLFPIMPLLQMSRRFKEERGGQQRHLVLYTGEQQSISVVDTRLNHSVGDGSTFTWHCLMVRNLVECFHGKGTGPDRYPTEDLKCLIQSLMLKPSCLITA